MPAIHNCDAAEACVEGLAFTAALQSGIGAAEPKSVDHESKGRLAGSPAGLLEDAAPAVAPVDVLRAPEQPGHVEDADRLHKKGNSRRCTSQRAEADFLSD